MKSIVKCDLCNHLTPRSEEQCGHCGYWFDTKEVAELRGDRYLDPNEDVFGYDYYRDLQIERRV